MNTLFKNMLRTLGITLLVATTATTNLLAFDPPVTGLSDWTLFIDQGHSQTENMGLYGYSEAEKVLRVGLHLRDMLVEQTDIGEVHVARNTDSDLIGLSARISLANQLGVDFYYSIHSDAGPPTANSTLMLWGGWRSNGQSVEKTPTGGKKMGEIMDTDLTASMRIARRGGYYDRTFYQGNVHHHANQWPYLAVNRQSNMASVLSEAGFHTNPTQQMRNLNAEWKKLEAQSAFWSILAFHDIPRPEVGIVTGYIRNLENNELINGATIEIGDFTYTTDTYESLFHKHSNDPDQLRNGFYYIEDLEPNSEVWVKVSAPGYYPDSVQVTVNPSFFTFADVSLVSSRPPFVETTTPGEGTDRHDPTAPILVEFSRPIEASTLDAQISIFPEVDFTYSMINPTTLRILTDTLEYEGEYAITLGEDIEDKYEHKIDGNNDGNSGGSFTLNFKVRPIDVDPPVVTAAFPSENQTNVDRNAILTFMFDEEVDPATITDESVKITKDFDGDEVEVTIRHYVVKERSVIQAFPTAPLEGETEYYGWLMPGIADLSGNTRTSSAITVFETERNLYSYATIDNFNSGINSWWVPQASGSTTGIETEETARGAESNIVNPLTGSSGAMFIEYGWDLGAAAKLIRTYLPPGASQNNTRFTTSNTLEAYVFGDNSGNLFRFMARDGANQLEGSPWYKLNWIGWKLVRWDLSTTPATPWVNGDGFVSGNAYTDSFQLTYESGAAAVGRIVVDDLRVGTKIPTVSIDRPDNELPDRVSLFQNYPNPFNPTTTLHFALPEAMPVGLTVYNLVGQRVAVLADGMMNAGFHNLQFDASNLASGVYIYRLQTPAGTQTGKMMLVK